jgi:hypothetical protein
MMLYNLYDSDNKTSSFSAEKTPGHSFISHADRHTATTNAVPEREVEAIAFAVGTTIGLNTGNAAADYIHWLAGNAAPLTENLEAGHSLNQATSRSPVK